MIFVRPEKIVKQIRSETIKQNDKQGLYKLRLVADDLLRNKTYKPCQVEGILIGISVDYFADMPEQLMKDSIRTIIQKCRSKKRDEAQGQEVDSEKPKSLYFYKEELEIIRSIDNMNAQYLAFAFLAYYKYIDGCRLTEDGKEIREWRKEKISDLVRVAKIDISGSTKTKLLRQLCERGIIEFRAIPDHMYIMGCRHEDDYGRERKIATAKFRMPICLNSGTGVITISNPDDDTLINYFRRYCGDNSIINCCSCECPIVKTNNRVKYCWDCAMKAKHKNVTE